MRDFRVADNDLPFSFSKQLLPKSMTFTALFDGWRKSKFCKTCLAYMSRTDNTDVLLASDRNEQLDDGARVTGREESVK